MILLEKILLIIAIVIIVLLISETQYRKKNLFLDYKKISSKNQINFLRLQKNYLSKCSIEDIEDLQIFIYKYLKERKKNERYK